MISRAGSSGLTMRGRLALFVSALLVLAAAGLSACSKETTPPAPLRPVLTIKITPITTERFGPFAGTVEARYETQLGFQTSGRIVARDVYVGDRVKTGQRLAALDPIIAQLGLTRAKADVADAEAQYSNAEGIARRQSILASEGSSTQAALDNAVAGRDTAKGRLDQAQAALRLAEHQIGYTELTSNFDGIVTAWSAEVGQYVNAGQAIVTIARSDSRDAVIDIPDDFMARVTPGMEFNVRLQESPRITAKAKVREITPLADPITRLHRVRLTLEDPVVAFRIGTTIAVESDHAVAPKILVPSAAVVDGDGDRGRYVWVLVDDGTKVARRVIEIAGTDGDDAVVKSGLAAGDRVVVVGVHSLHDGQTVAGEAGTAGKAEAAKL
jgi:RND family efflux transporter MFP subunit